MDFDLKKYAPQLATITTNSSNSDKNVKLNNNHNNGNYSNEYQLEYLTENYSILSDESSNWVHVLQKV